MRPAKLRPLASSYLLASVCVFAVPAALAAQPAGAAAGETQAQPAATPSMAEVLAASAPGDWRRPDPENVLYLDMPGGRVIIELAPEFTPNHVANIKLLARENYFDGLSFIRSQDNYVVQWGDPSEKKTIKTAKKALMVEFTRPSEGLPFTRLPDGDVYAPEVGFANGLPVARDPAKGIAWLTHCYGMVGVGRGNELDSGNGAEIYVVIGHSPRHLDRNVTLVGRVLQGMDLLSVLPRGKGNLGFYEEPAQYVPIHQIRVEADVPPAQRTPLEVLRTDTKTFEALVQSRRFRREEWFKEPVGHIELCNVPLPVRAAAAQSAAAPAAN